MHMEIDFLLSKLYNIISLVCYINTRGFHFVKKSQNDLEFCLM